jgi:CheY-like chemotaxis protein
LSLSKFIKLDEKFSKIKFLLLISSAADELSLEAGLDIDAIIEKPISPKELVERLISVLQGDDT